MPLLLLSFSLTLISRNLKNYRSKSSNWHAVHGFAFVIIRLNIKSPMMSRNINDFPREPVAQGTGGGPDPVLHCSGSHPS